MTSADNAASMALRTSRDQCGRDDDEDLGLLRRSHPDWLIERNGRGQIDCTRGGYHLTTYTVSSAGLGMTERETGRGLTGEAILRT